MNVNLTIQERPIDVSEKIKAYRSSWREYNSELKKGNIKPDLKIGISATVTVDPIVPLIGAELLNEGYKPKVFVGPYNQVFQTCFDWRGAFQISDETEPDAIILLWRIDEILAEEIVNYRQGDDDALNRSVEKIDELSDAIRYLRSNFEGIILVNAPSRQQNVEIDVLDVDNSMSVSSFFHTLSLHWFNLIKQIGRVNSIDLDAILSDFGYSDSSDARKWYLYHQPYKEKFWYFLANQLTRHICSIQGKTKKCIVVDCDNTLWGGIIGEDGLDKIQLGDDFPGSAFRDFQKQLVHLHSKGVLIAISSKNNENDVWEVFQKHDAMVLKQEHLATWRINWELKSNNIVEIANDLNIGSDSFVFIDDNPVEIGEMMHRRPEVVCLQVPKEVSYLPDMLKKCFLFDRHNITDEDRKRTAMIRTDADRKRIKQTMSEVDFLKTLELKTNIFSPKAEHLNRVTQLINKTNQFNLTTIRRNQDEVETLIKQNIFKVYCLTVSDKFGEYGLVGVAIAVKKSDLIWYIDTFLLSCRVLSRGVETAFLAFIAEEMKKLGAMTIEGRYVPTLKNVLVEKFYPDHGFTPLDDNNWRFDLNTSIDSPSHILVNSPKDG